MYLSVYVVKRPRRRVCICILRRGQWTRSGYDVRLSCIRGANLSRDRSESLLERKTFAGVQGGSQPCEYGACSYSQHSTRSHA